jgi:two-component system sensor histidine kinase/response regulator
VRRAVRSESSSAISGGPSVADIELVEADRLAGMLTRVHQMEAFLKMVLSTSAAGLLVTNSDGEIVSCNDEIEQLFQWSPAQLHGRTIDLLLRLRSDNAGQVGIASSLQTIVNPAAVVEGVRRDGSVFSAQLTVARLMGASGEAERLCISLLDVSSRKAGEEEIVRSRNELQAIIDNSPGLICLKDEAGRYLFVNQNFADFFRIERQSLRGKTDFDLFPTRVAETFSMLDRAALSRLSPVREEFSADVDQTLKALVGDRVLLSLRVPLRDVHLALKGLLTVAEDITEEKIRRAETKKRLDEQRLIFDNSPMGILITSEEWIVHANPVAARILGWDLPSALVGWEIAEMFASPEDYARFEKMAKPLLDARQRAVIEWELYRRDRSVFSAKLSSQDMPAAQGITSTVWILEDVSEIKRAEREQQAARELQETVLRSKSEFLVNMSHEIRTPMNAILGFCELSLQGELGEKQRDYIAKAHESGLLMLRLVNDILDFAKADAKMFSLQQEDFELSDLLAMLETVAGSVARRKELSFEIALDPDVPQGLRGDTLRLLQVLINLVGNATKFTAAGKIALGVRCSAARGSDVELEFSVRDTGAGIEPRYHGQIFQAFSQGDSSITRKHGGTGLGLSISTALVELMGGKLWLDSSEPGRGSDFRFTARVGLREPVDTAAARPRDQDRRPAPPAQDLRGVQVLVVEDNEFNQEIVGEILREQGALVTCADNGRLALERLAGGGRYDIVLLDIQMPEMDGFETIARIRATPALAGLKVIAFTAHAMLGERERCIGAGMDDFMTKPIHRAKLLGMMHKLLGSAQVAGAS